MICPDRALQDGFCAVAGVRLRYRPAEFLGGSGNIRPVIEDNLEEIGRLCRLHGVRKPEVFMNGLYQAALRIAP